MRMRKMGIRRRVDWSSDESLRLASEACVAPRRWRRWAIAATVVTCGSLLLAWWLGGFTRSAGRVVKDGLEKANTKDYEGAARNLVSDLRALYAKRPELREATLEALTRHSTITEVTIDEVSHGDKIAKVKYEILYKDGKRLSLHDTCRFEDG